jgi:hypothetical protein
MFVVFPTAAILKVGSLHYGMTANARRIRLWRRRLATSLALKPAIVGSAAGYFWAAAKFIIAGSLATTRSCKKVPAAADPLEALCRLPTRLDF